MTPPQLLPPLPAMHADKVKASSTTSVLSTTKDDDDDVFGGADVRSRISLGTFLQAPIAPPKHGSNASPPEDRPKSNQLEVEITPENAQDFLEPDHVVFVAK